MTNLDNEINRIATFVNWRLNYPNAFNLARAGLAYTGTGDIVYCYKCKCTIKDWKENDVPIERHRHASPNCPLVASHSLPDYRLPHRPTIISQPSEDATRPQDPVHHPRQYQPGESSSMHFAPARSQMPISNNSSLGADNLQVGAHLKFEIHRFGTFDSWTNPYVNSRDLAKAGFFFTRIGDCVKCAFCSNILKQWEQGDVPFDEHRKHYPKCPFVLGSNVGNVPDDRVMHTQPTHVTQPHPQPTRVMQPQDSTAAVGGGGAGGKGKSPMVS